jgi:hypothetical protein
LKVKKLKVEGDEFILGKEKFLPFLNTISIMGVSLNHLRNRKLRDGNVCQCFLKNGSPALPCKSARYQRPFHAGFSVQSGLLKNGLPFH